MRMLPRLAALVLACTVAGVARPVTAEAGEQPLTPTLSRGERGIATTSTGARSHPATEPEPEGTHTAPALVANPPDRPPFPPGEGPGVRAATNDDKPATGRIQVTDDTARAVQLPAPARRIVTLSPHATELVFAAGGGEHLLAVAPYSDFPPEAARLPTIGGLGGLDRERLLALAPDLVVAWDSGNRPADLAWLDSLDIAVYRSEPRALDDIARNLLDLGRLAGTEAAAEQAAAAYRRALADACPQPASPALRAFIQLAARPPLTVGGGHWLDQAVRRAGLHNVFAELPGRAVVVGQESLRAARPDVTLYLAYPGAAPAAAGGSAIGLAPGLWARPGPRLPSGISALCRALPHNRAPHAVTSGAGNSLHAGSLTQ